MANRCLSSRTNAWTDTDHTCYTVYTAGTSGFLNILPVYMDHILFPRLREEDFKTEVHHISGEGEDAGVVYSEMQVNRLKSRQRPLPDDFFRHGSTI
jgi:Zn-dependent M16 (insulinase) family peptidase